jgi:hypothetical protein
MSSRVLANKIELELFVKAKIRFLIVDHPPSINASRIRENKMDLEIFGDAQFLSLIVEELSFNKLHQNFVPIKSTMNFS